MKQGVASPKYRTCHAPSIRMTQELETMVRRMDRDTATQILVAVRGTLEALRRDVATLNATPETREVLRRIDAYLGHVESEKGRLTG